MASAFELLAEAQAKAFHHNLPPMLAQIAEVDVFARQHRDLPRRRVVCKG